MEEQLLIQINVLLMKKHNPIIENCKSSDINLSYTMPSDISIIDKEYEVTPSIVQATLKLDELAKILRKKKNERRSYFF